MVRNRIDGCWLVWMCAAIAPLGCSARTPEQRLAGHWVGAPNVAAEIHQTIAATPEAQDLPPLAKGMAQFVGQLAANQILGVDLHLKPTGGLLVQGNAEVLGMPHDADGTFRVVSANDDSWTLELTVGQKARSAKLIWIKPHEFLLKLPVPVKTDEAATPTDAAVEPQTKEVSVTFKRAK